MTEMDVAKMMFGWANVPTSTMLVSSSADEKSNVRYGTVVAVNEDGTYDVQLDTGETITMESETPLEEGDRISLVNQDGSWVLYGMSTFVTEMRNKTVELAESIKEQGEEISQGVLDSLAEFEASHGLTDIDVTKSLEDLETSITTTLVGEIAEGGIQYKTLSELTQSVGTLESKAETYFSDDAEGIAKLQSTIQQNPQIIQSTVQSEVENVVGDTYATKTELKQTSDSLSLSVSGAVNKADAAKESADDSADFIDTYFSATTAGLTISSSASSYKTRVAASSFDILNASNVLLLSMGVNNNYPTITAGGSYNAVGLCGASSFGQFQVGSTLDVDGASDFSLRRTGFLSDNLGDDLPGTYHAWWTLYNSTAGTTGTITLSKTLYWHEFEHLLIVFKDSLGALNSTIVKAPSNSAAVVYATLVSSYMNPGVYSENKTVKITQNTISNYVVADTHPNAGGRSYISIGGSSVNAAAGSAYITILQVIGFRY